MDLPDALLHPACPLHSSRELGVALQHISEIVYTESVSFVLLCVFMRHLRIRSCVCCSNAYEPGSHCTGPVPDQCADNKQP